MVLFGGEDWEVGRKIGVGRDGVSDEVNDCLIERAGGELLGANCFFECLRVSNEFCEKRIVFYLTMTKVYSNKAKRVTRLNDVYQILLEH